MNKFFKVNKFNWEKVWRKNKKQQTIVIITLNAWSEFITFAFLKNSQRLEQANIVGYSFFFFTIFGYFICNCFICIGYITLGHRFDVTPMTRLTLYVKVNQNQTKTSSEIAMTAAAAVAAKAAASDENIRTKIEKQITFSSLKWLK